MARNLARTSPGLREDAQTWPPCSCLAMVEIVTGPLPTELLAAVRQKIRSPPGDFPFGLVSVRIVIPH